MTCGEKDSNITNAKYMQTMSLSVMQNKLMCDEYFLVWKYKMYFHTSHFMNNTNSNIQFGVSKFFFLSANNYQHMLILDTVSS